MSTVDELEAHRVRLGMTGPPPVVTPEQLAAMARNRALSIAQYGGNPYGFMDEEEEDRPSRPALPVAHVEAPK